jgi:hypothetical protein
MRVSSMLALSILAVCLGGCAQDLHRGALTADDHRREAALNHAAAESHLSSYDPRAATQVRPGGLDEPGGAIAQRVIAYNPTEWHLRAAQRYSEHAREHERAAATLEAFAAAECEFTAPKARSTCPFFGPIRRVEDLTDGVRLQLEPDAPVADLVAHVRCHLAYAKVHGDEAPSCPLMIRGVEASLSSDGHDIVLRARQRAVARELQLRAHASVDPTP